MLQLPIKVKLQVIWSFPGGSVIKNPLANAGRCRRRWFNPWVRKIPWKRKWQPTPVFLLSKSHVQRNLAGYSPQSLKELDTIERLSTHSQEIYLRY